MLSDKTIKNIRRASVVLLIGLPFLFVVSFLDKGKPFEELTGFTGELVSVEKKKYGYSAGTLWLTLSDAEGEFTACIRSYWRDINSIPVGSEIEVIGYGDRFGPCGVQAMQISSDGRLIVSYADFIKNLEFSNRRLRYMSGTLFLSSLLAFLYSFYTRPDIKTFS